MQSVCIEMCQQKYPSIFAERRKRSASLQANLLRWSHNDENGDLRNLGYYQGDKYQGNAPISDGALSPAPFRTFDIVIASDCLFFKDFHPDLYWLLKHVTVPGSVVFMLQPPRSGTMQLFLDIVAMENYFECVLSSDYIPEVCLVCAPKYMMLTRLSQSIDVRALYQVTKKHNEYMAEDREGLYDPDIHYATLIKLTRLR